MARDLTEGQLRAISIIERVGSGCSLLGSLFVIITFLCSKAFHKPINRLVFYASFGNMMTNVGTLMSRGYLDSLDSFGCQFQGFLIQMFMPADAFWTLAMACNVYLTFYHKFDAARLRKMELWYLLLCYGIPFVPALTYIFVRKEGYSRMYGNATLWCWISTDWDVFRIATFYGPVWVVIMITMFIYIRTGGEIFKKRKQLRHFGGSNSAHGPEPLTMDDPFSVKTTEVTVTRESAADDKDELDLAPFGRIVPTKQTYSVTISSDNKPSGQTQEGNASQNNLPQTPMTGRFRSKTQKRRANYEANNAAWSYSKCAILFFTALLITWIPSSANRVYGLVKAKDVSATLEIMSAIVLPLQGFWNCLIYVSTSWEAAKITFADVKARLGGHRPDNNSRYGREMGNYTFKLSSRSSRKDVETESMTELANASDGVSNSNQELKGVAV